ncbi:hypothetical protein RND81_05G010700 [Saponaria officinalis]|uniref:Transcription repressor n=1 Tax=Saponaria officinalis TaxID=3572 RepID=A0AAW1KTC2_SAPOF
MGKRTNKLIPFLSQSKSLDSKLNNNDNNNNSSTPWIFPSCGNIKTLSFRENNNNFYKDDNFKTFNSAFLDTPESFFTNLSSSRSFSTTSNDYSADPIDESVIRGLRSDRLFFEPHLSCSLVFQPQLPNKHRRECEEETAEVVYKESEAMCVESKNPSEDFRRSMEEMVEAHGLKDLQGLEELLSCYLKINDQINHSYIMAAFIDLLINYSFISSSSNTTTTTNNNNINNSSTSSSSLLSNNNINSSSPSSPLSLSSLFDLGDDDDHCNHDDR